MTDDFHKRVGKEHKPRNRRSRAVQDKGAPRALQYETFEVEAVSGSGSSGTAQTKEEPKPKDGVRHWVRQDDIFFGIPDPAILKAIPAGYYIPTAIPNIGAAVMKRTLSIDKLMRLPDDSSAKVIAEFEHFWTLGEAFKSRGFLHKRGFLLYGPPGSGKTSTIQLLIAELISQQQGIVLQVDHPGLAGEVMQLIRKLEPHRPMICLMEDFDTLIDRFGEDEYLALLDGEAQINKVVFLATTNYPERLDPRFTDRPSRFDTIKMIGMPSADARRVYLKAKEPTLKGAELETWVKLSDGLSLAHMKEMIIAVKCFGQDVNDVAERLENMKQKPKSTDAPSRNGSGFLSAVNLRNAGAFN